MGHGFAVLGRGTGQYMQKLNSGAPAEELKTMGAYLLRHANISLGLMVIAVIGMDGARYL